VLLRKSRAGSVRVIVLPNRKPLEVVRAHRCNVPSKIREWKPLASRSNVNRLTCSTLRHSCVRRNREVKKLTPLSSSLFDHRLLARFVLCWTPRYFSLVSLIYMSFNLPLSLICPLFLLRAFVQSSVLSCQGTSAFHLPRHWGCCRRCPYRCLA